MTASPNTVCNTDGYLPMTGSQKWLMKELLRFQRPGWVSIEFLVKTKVPMDEKAMEEAIRHLVDKYENLRVRISNRDGQWIQEIYPLSVAEPFSLHDLSREDPHIRGEKIRQLCIKERDWLLPGRGNLIRLLFFKLSENEGRIWFCMHHAISDFVSVVLLSTEFMTTYHSLIQGRELKAQPVKDYRKWLYMVEGYSRDVLLPSELDYWISLPWEKAKVIPSDYPEKFYRDDIIVEAIDNKKLIGSYRTDVQWMDQDDTLRLFAKYGVELENTLLAVFFLVVSDRKKVDWLDLNVSYSGRNILPQEYGVSVNRLLGFLSAVRAVLLKNPGSGDLLQDVRDVIEQIKNIPNGGIGYSLIINHIRNDQLKESYIRFRKQPQILFNYLGRAGAGLNDGQYEMVEEDIGWELYPEEIKNTLLECVTGIQQNKLFLRISYSEEYFNAGTIEEIMQSILGALNEIVCGQKIEKVL